MEEGIPQDLTHILDSDENINIFDAIGSGDVSMESPEDGEGEPQIMGSVTDMMELDDTDVVSLGAIQDNFNYKKRMIRTHLKKNRLNESDSLPRELSGGAGIILCILANFNSPSGWTTRDTDFFPGSAISSYAKATHAQVSALSAYFGKNILPGAAKAPSGEGADLAFEGGCNAYPSGPNNGFESKSKTDHNGGNYNLFKEFGDKFDTSLGSVLQAEGFAWARKTATPTEIANGIAGLSKAEYKTFCSLVEAHISKEGLLVPNYTVGKIWGAKSTDVVSAWRTACGTGPKNNSIMVAQYSPTRRGISFSVPTILVADHPNIAARMTTTRSDLLDKARKAGFNLALAIRAKFGNETNWENYLSTSGESASPRSWAQATDPNQRANETNDIRAFFVAKGKKSSISFGNYKLIPGIKGGGYSDAYHDLLQKTTSTDGDSTPAGKKSAPPTPPTPPSPPADSSSTGFDFDQVGGTYRGKVRNADAQDPAKIKILVKALVAGDITLDVFSGSQRSIFEKAMKAALKKSKAKSGGTPPVVKKARKSKSPKAKYPVPSSTWKARKKLPSSGKYRKAVEDWSSDTGQSMAKFKKLGTGPKNAFDISDFIAANENTNKYNLMSRLFESLDVPDQETELEFNELLNDPTMDLNPEIEDIFYAELANELELAGIEVPLI